MVNNNENIEIKQYLRLLGLTVEETDVYLDLTSHGESTPLLIARRTGINRTKVYRVVEEMAREKLVEVEVGSKTTYVAPAPIEQLERRLAQKQQRVAMLTRGWADAASSLEQLGVQEKAETKIKYYKGRAGIEQMVWNVLSAKGEIIGYTVADLSHYVGEKFMQEFVAEFTRRNLRMRDIYGDEYQASKPVQYDWGGRVVSRYLPKTILEIPHQMDIYDEVVTFYDWVGGEVWGTEIRNPKVATMQKQLFELAWEKGKEI